MDRQQALYEAREISAQLDRLQGRLADLHLMKSMHAVNNAVRVFGWELAEHLEKAGK